MERFPVKVASFTFVALIAAYQSAIWLGLPPSDGADQWEGNRIRLERYSDGSTPVPLAMAGSSLTANIPIVALVPGAANLGLSGGGVRTVFAAMAKSKRHSSVVVVEMGELLLKEQDDQLLNAVFSPWGMWLCQSFSMFKTEYRPISVLVQILKNLKHESSDDVDPLIRAAALRRVFAIEAIPLSQDEKTKLTVVAAEVRTAITNLTHNGSCVLLVDIPSEPAVQGAVRHREVQEILLSVLPQSEFHWLTPPSWKWTTNDGVHLTKASVLVFAKYLAASARC